MNTRIVTVPGWKRPSGYSNGMIAEGKVLNVAGQIGWDENEIIVPGGFPAQFERALRNVVAIVEAAGGTPLDIVSLRIFSLDLSWFREPQKRNILGQIFRTVLGKHFPTNAAVRIVELVEKDALVEIEAVAILSQE